MSNKPQLLGLPFTGIIGGCGTHIRIGEEDILYRTVEVEQVKVVVETFRKYDIPLILEGRDCRYVDTRITGHSKLEGFKRDAGENLKDIYTEDMRWEINKFTALTLGKEYETPIKELSHWFDFPIYTGGVAAEGLPKGYSKAFGIRYVCEKPGIDLKDTYCFGDSVNDLEMMACVGTAISMGNGSEEAKKAADYVTDPLYENGIYNACRHFSLI